MAHPSSIVIIPVVAAVLIATVTDLRTRRIPNWLVFPFLLAGLGTNTVMNRWSGLENSLLGLLTGAAVMGLFCFLGGMGMGDLKLCAAVGAWIGPGQLVIALVTTGLVGGLMALVWAFAGGFARELFFGTGDLILGIPKRGLRRHPTLTLENPSSRKMPYAPAIAIGTILSFWST
jgi:prepilin peptidase CpaA